MMGLTISTETKLSYRVDFLFVIDVLRDIDIFTVQLSRYYFRNNISFSFGRNVRVSLANISAKNRNTQECGWSRNLNCFLSGGLKLIKLILCAWRRWYYLLFVNGYLRENTWLCDQNTRRRSDETDGTWVHGDKEKGREREKGNKNATIF